MNNGFKKTIHIGGYIMLGRIKGKGMKNIIGPFGFSDKDPQGFMIEGFDEPMIITTNCNLPYMSELMDQCGYKKEIDLHEYKLIIPIVSCT